MPEQQLFHNASLPRMGAAHMMIRPADMHADLGAGVPAEHRPVVDKRRARPVAGGGYCRANAGNSAARYQNVKAFLHLISHVSGFLRWVGACLKTGSGL